jgi:hypothetical protein
MRTPSTPVIDHRQGAGQDVREKRTLIGEEAQEPTFAEELKARGVSVAGELMRTVLWSRRVAIALLAVR